MEMKRELLRHYTNGGEVVVEKREEQRNEEGMLKGGEGNERSRGKGKI